MINPSFDPSENSQSAEDLQDERWRSNRKWLVLVFGTWLLLAVAMLFNTIYEKW